MDRRNFFKTVIGGITFTLAAKNIPVVEAKTIAPATTVLGKELSKNLVPKGFYNVVIKDIVNRESKLRPGEYFFDFILETKDGRLLHSMASPRAPFQIMTMLEQTKTMPTDITAPVELNNLIGKEIKVKVDIETYQDRNVNRVEVK